MGKKFSSFADRAAKVFSTMGSDTLHVGFSNIDLWVGMGNYALNRLLSNDYKKAFLFGRMGVLAGEPGSGKSLFSAKICSLAQKDLGAYILWVDVEKATDDSAGKQWLKDAGVDIDTNFQYISCATPSEGMKIVSHFVSMYRKAKNEAQDDEEIDLPPVIIIFDSLSAFIADSQLDKAKKGDNVSDQGLRAKQVGDLVLKSNHLLAGLPILTLGVLHVYMSQEEYGPQHKVTGGIKTIYMASTALMLTKAQLTAENSEDTSYGEGLTEKERKKVNVGMFSRAKVLKSRFSKPFEEVIVEVPFEKGIDPYSGLLDVMMQDGIVHHEEGSQFYTATLPSGEELKFYKKNFRQHADALMTIPIPKLRGKGVDLAPVELKKEIDAAAETTELDESAETAVALRTPSKKKAKK